MPKNIASETNVSDIAPSVTFLTSLAAVRMLKECTVIDLTVDDFEFLTRSRIWLPIDRSRARRCVEAAVYGGLDYVGFPRYPAPLEFIAAAIAVYVHPQNIQIACLIMEGAEFTENIINGIEQPVRPHELFAHVLRILAGDVFRVDAADLTMRNSPKLLE